MMLDYMREFMALAEFKNFTLAAEIKLNLSTGFMQHINALEEKSV
jgi:DNA-binding transcriptional LysR family regulator